jgi:hypothetical protein
MTTNLIDLRRPCESSGDDLPGLQAYLAQLVGEAFRLARVSYGNELTLHFGDLRPARSPKRNGQPYGAYILGMRASPCVLKAGTEPLVIASGVLNPLVPSEYARPIGKEELESSSFIAPDSRVMAATPFVVEPADSFGLHLRMSDGSGLLVLPTASEDDDVDGGLPVLAAWELLSPGGLLSAGPGRKWSFAPAAVAAARTNA